MKSKYIITLLVALAVPSFLIAEDEEDQTVELSALPAPVAAAITKATGGAKLEKITLEDENGTKAYEAVWLVNGQKNEVSVSATGQVLASEDAEDDKDEHDGDKEDKEDEKD